MKKHFATLAAASAISLLAVHDAPAATLQGDTITVEYRFPDLGTLFSSDTIVAGAGVEVDCPGTSLVCSTLIEPYSLDFGIDTISFQQSGTPFPYSSAAFNGWVFSGIDFGTGITGVSLTSSGIPGLGLSDVIFTTTSVSIDFSNTVGNTSNPNSWTLKLVSDPSPVPLPAAGWMLLAGLGGIAAMKRRKNADA